MLVETDAGQGYLKAIGNPEGPHALVCEYVGTQLAEWFGLPVFDYCLLQLTAEDEIPLTNGLAEVPSTAFITRSETGDKWGGDPSQLRLLTNPEDISRLIVFDTWTRNCDRYSITELGGVQRIRQKQDNVFLSGESQEAGKLALRAMDHTCCFSCGAPLSKKLSAIDSIRDERLFGVFPAFRPFVDRTAVQEAARDLRRLDRVTIESMLASVPAEWELDTQTRSALCDLIVRRAEFVADTIEGRLFPQGELFPNPETTE